MDLGIILVAAGASTRMGFDKLWAGLEGRPLLAYALEAAREARPAELVVVVASERLNDASALAPDARVVSGGPRRRDSVARGLAACNAEWVAVHDAARALAPSRLFTEGLATAAAERGAGAAIPVVPVKDTIKQVVDGHVRDTLARAEHALVQTPQIFRRDLLVRALASTDLDVTDESALVEALGIRVATFPGDERAFKLTTPLDFALARSIVGVRPRA